jgi:hypothetical protein
MYEANKGAGKTATAIIAGNIINDRLAKIITPKAPIMVRGYLDSPFGKAVVSNAVAAALIHFFPGNKKIQVATSAMIEAAMVEFSSSFNIEEMVDELLDGVTLPDVNLKNTMKETTGIRLASDEDESA